MSGVVLMYHRVAAVQNDPYGLAVHPRHFAAHVDYLASIGGVVPLDEIVEPGRARKISITFDDGYADNATAAAPLLAEAVLPATYFITTGRLGGQRFWWDRLSAAFLGEHVLPAGVDVSVGGRDVWLALNDVAARATALRFLHRRLRPLPPDDLLATVDDLLLRLNAPMPADSELTMSVDQLRATAALPLAEIGAHTRTHLQLGGQTQILQQAEIAGSLSDLELLLDRPVTSFAYPFGSREAVGELAPRLAREAGCVVACSTEYGAVSDGSSAHRLPRVNVADWGADQLASEIQRVAQGRYERT